MKMHWFVSKSSIWVCMVASLVIVAGQPLKVNAAPDGAKIYAAKCALCHPGGKNVTKPNKPVVGSKTIATVEKLKEFLLKQNGTMPAFPKIAEDKEALKALHAYLKTLK